MAIHYLNFESKKLSQGVSVDWIVSGSDSVQMWATLNMMLAKPLGSVQGGEFFNYLNES